jgi:TM2 domain-containing membrane protein YozV
MQGTRRSRDWLPVWLSLVVWPGAGQMYQGQRVKGLALVAASTVFGLAFAVLAGLVVLRALPADLALLDPLTFLASLRRAVLGQLPMILAAALPLAAVWVYAVVDAWRGR